MTLLQPLYLNPMLIIVSNDYFLLKLLDSNAISIKIIIFKFISPLFISRARILVTSSVVQPKKDTNCTILNYTTLA